MGLGNVRLASERFAAAPELLEHIISAGDDPLSSAWRVVRVRIHLAVWLAKRCEVVRARKQPILQVFVSHCYKVVEGM